MPLQLATRIIDSSGNLIVTPGERPVYDLNTVFSGLTASPMPGRTDAPITNNPMSLALGPVALNLGTGEPGRMMPVPTTSSGPSLGNIIGTAVGGGGLTGTVIGTVLDIGLGLLDPGRSQTPMTMAPAVIAPMAGTVGRSLITGGLEMAGGAIMGGMMSMLGGGRMRVPRGAKRILRSLTPVIGLPAAASTLGLSLDVAARIFARPSRRRGISAADVRRTYRVLNFTSRIKSHLSKSGICRKR